MVRPITSMWMLCDISGHYYLPLTHRSIIPVVLAFVDRVLYMYVWKDAVRDLPVYVNSHAQCKNSYESRFIANEFHPDHISNTYISHQSEPATVTESIVVSLGYTPKAFVIFAGSIWILARNAECILSNTDQWLVEIQRHGGQIQWPKMTRNTEPISFWKTLPTVTISNTYVLSELWHSSYFFPTNDDRYEQWLLLRGGITLKEHCIARLNWGKDKLCQTYLQPISRLWSPPSDV